MRGAMPEIRFYHLQRQPVEEALPRLLEKVLQAGHKALVKVPDKGLAETLDKALWIYDPGSFLPHARAGGDHDADQPVLLTTDDDNPADADVLVLIDGTASPDIERYDRTLYMFDGRNPDIVEAARTHWRDFKAAGLAMSYWQQGERGGWQQVQQVAGSGS